MKNRIMYLSVMSSSRKKILHERKRRKTEKKSWRIG